MKVLCVTTECDGKWSSFSSKRMLAIGRWYDVVDGGDDFYTIIWFNGLINREANLSKSYFKTVEELREDKLKELGIK